MQFVIGVPKEIKNKEGRVGLTPQAIRRLFRMELATVLVEKDAGLLSGYTDDDYQRAGAAIAANAKEVYKNSSMIIKVKEITSVELPLLKKWHTIYTFLHAADNEEMVKEFLKKNILGISYDTLEDEHGNLPILKEMSIVAGELSIENGMKIKPDIKKVAIVGCGNAGYAAIRIALQNNLEIIALDTNQNRLFDIQNLQEGKIKTILSNTENLKKILSDIDLLVGAPLKHGELAPKIITREMVKMMKKGSMIVDISIDQGGCVETSRPTSHDEPTFTEEGVIHYCVTNMPGSVPHRSTPALVEAHFPYLVRILKGDIFPPKNALEKGILKGINTFKGFVTHTAVAKALPHLPYKPLEEFA